MERDESLDDLSEKSCIIVKDINLFESVDAMRESSLGYSHNRLIEFILFHASDDEEAIFRKLIWSKNVINMNLTQSFSDEFGILEKGKSYIFYFPNDEVYWAIRNLIGFEILGIIKVPITKTFNALCLKRVHNCSLFLHSPLEFNKIENINLHATHMIKICQEYYRNDQFISIMCIHIEDLKKVITQSYIENKVFILHAKKIKNSLEQFCVLLNQADENSSAMLNKTHRNLMKGLNQKNIFYVIRFILAGLRSCAQKIVANIGVKNKKTLKELSCFMTIVISYGVVQCITDCLLHTHLISLLVSFILDAFGGNPKNIEAVKGMANIIYLENEETNPDFFFALKEYFAPHLDHLLENDKIFQGFLELDSIEIEAIDEKEANNALLIIVQRALPKNLIMFDDFNIFEVQDHRYNAIPKSKEVVRRHLNDLLPKEIIVIPERRGLNRFYFVGKTLIDGKIALKDYLLAHPFKKISLAKLLLVLIHELSHKKRFLCSSVGEASKKTPEKFKSEAGMFIDSLRFGEFIKSSSINISCIDEDLATKIIATEELSQDLVEKLFPSNLETESRGMKSSSDLDEDIEVMCEGRISKPRYY